MKCHFIIVAVVEYIIKNGVFMSRKLSYIGLSAIGLVLMAGCASGSSNADIDFPAEDIHLVVPWDAGGDGDLTARTLAPLMEDELGVNIIVENRPGANGSVGYTWLLDQKADGYTISMAGPEVATLQFQDYEIDPEDYAFIGQGISGPGAVAVPADSPYETLDELLEAGAEAPDEISFSSPGVGSVWDLATQRLIAESDAEFSSIPFDGSAPAVHAASSGHVDFTTSAIGLLGPQVDGGEMRFLAMLTEERLEDYPDVPTAKELGVDVEHATWVGMMAPAETPDEVVEVLSDAMRTAVEDEEFQDTMINADIIPLSRTSSEMDEFVLEQAEISRPLFDGMVSEQ